MRKIVLLLACCLWMSLPMAGQAAQESSGSISMEFDLSAQGAGGETKLWIPYPMSDSDQTITNISINGDFAESAVYSDNKYSTPMLYCWDLLAQRRRQECTIPAHNYWCTCATLSTLSRWPLLHVMMSSFQPRTEYVPSVSSSPKFCRQ